VSFITRRTNAVATIILSAMGSKSSPSFDSCLYNLANKPSKKSVKLANKNIKKELFHRKNLEEKRRLQRMVQ